MLLILAVCQLVTIEHVSAETPEAAEIEFSCATWKGLGYSKVLYRYGNELREIELRPDVYSKLYPLPAGQGLELYERLEDQQGNSEFKLIGTAPVLEGVRSILYLLEKSNEPSDLPLRLYTLDNTRETFPRGTFRFVNLTLDVLQIELGGVKKELVEWSPVVIDSDVPDSGAFIPFLVSKMETKAVADAEGEAVVEPKVIYETRLMGQAAKRITLFIYPPEGENKRIKIKYLSQIVRVEEKGK